MRIQRLIFSAVLSSALLLTGCAGAKAASPQPSAAPTATVSPSPTATPVPDALPDSLLAALDGCLAFETGTAGSSLQAAQAADRLMLALIQDGTPEKLPDLANDWKDGLTPEDAALLTNNWPTISSTARQVAADPEGQADYLQSAGVMTDYTTLPLDAIPAAFDALDSVFLETD